jgi:hypothetical protein
LPLQGHWGLEINVRKLCSVMKYLGQKAVPVLKEYAGAKKAIISEMICVGRKDVSFFNVTIKIMII